MSTTHAKLMIPAWLIKDENSKHWISHKHTGLSKIDKILCLWLLLKTKKYYSWSIVNILFLNNYHSTVCSCHVTYAFHSESTLYSCLNVKELLARSWSDCNWTQTQNHLVLKPSRVAKNKRQQTVRVGVRFFVTLKTAKYFWLN